jgi:hypothetical protein
VVPALVLIPAPDAPQNEDAGREPGAPPIHDVAASIMPTRTSIVASLFGKRYDPLCLLFVLDAEGLCEDLLDFFEVSWDIAEIPAYSL